MSFATAPMGDNPDEQSRRRSAAKLVAAGGVKQASQLEGAGRGTCGLVPTSANACVPICTPAGAIVVVGAVSGCACSNGPGPIVSSPIYSPIDASHAHWC